MDDTHFYEPANGHRLPHSPLKAVIAPRPIGWVSSVDCDGKVNLAPFSFFNAVCETPPMVYFTVLGRKDTLRNVEATGEFVVNMASRELAEQMSLTSADLPPGHDEMQFAGLEPAASTLVRPPRVKVAPAALECKVLRIEELADLQGNKVGWFMVLGQVVGVHLNRAFLKDGLFDTAAARLIARCGYRGFYASVDEMFEMVRPTDVSVLSKT
ncbi:MAG: flavin reductase family protein [Burkholderiales bacterium]|nr:flavin reductase family protein [Burkholderiales bacterium]